MLRDERELSIVGDIERRWRSPNKSRNLPTRYLGHIFQRIVKLLIHLIHPRCQAMSISQVAFEIQEELIMDVVENGAYALARYEAEVTGYR